VSRKKKIFYLILILSIIILAALIARAIIAKKTVKLPPSIEKIQESEGVPVKVVSPSKTDLEEVLLVDGTVEAGKKALVVSRIDQKIEKITVDEGDPVQKGVAVVFLERDAAESAVQADRVARQEAERDFERARALFQNGAIARQDLDQARVKLEAAQARYQQSLEHLGDTTIASPLTGLVSKRYKEPGELASKGNPILEIVAIEDIEINSSLSETLIQHVHKNQPVRVTLDAYPDRVWEAEISTINPTAREISRLFTVKIELPNRQNLLRPGMYARVEIVKDIRRGVMVLPQEAVIEDSRGHPGVFLLCDDDRVSFRPVEIGISQRGKVEIASGLDYACRVVVRGQDRLEDGEKVKVTEEL